MASQLCHKAVSRVIASAWRHHCAHHRYSPPSGRRYMGRKCRPTQSSTLPYRGSAGSSWSAAGCGAEPAVMELPWSRLLPPRAELLAADLPVDRLDRGGSDAVRLGAAGLPAHALRLAQQAVDPACSVGEGGGDLAVVQLAVVAVAQQADAVDDD